VYAVSAGKTGNSGCKARTSDISEGRVQTIDESFATTVESFQNQSYVTPLFLVTYFFNIEDLIQNMPDTELCMCGMERGSVGLLLLGMQIYSRKQLVESMWSISCASWCKCRTW